MVFDHEILDDLITKKMKKDCQGCNSTPGIRMLPSGCVLPEKYLQFAQRIRDMEVRSDDIWVCSYPKCGTTWTTEMVWLLNNGLNFEAAKSTELLKRFPYLDWPEDGFKEIPDPVAYVEQQKSPRFIQSHLPPSLLPKQLLKINPKIIYVTRNPKDAAVSYFYYFRLWNNYSGTLNDFLEAFLEDKLPYSPFWKHVLSFWELKDKKNVLISSFEDMKNDLSKVMKRTANFLGISYTKTQEIELLDHLNFKNMKINPMVNYEKQIIEWGKYNMHFIRNGKIGAWKQEMTTEMVEKFDSWTIRNLKGSDFPLYLNSCKG